LGAEGVTNFGQANENISSSKLRSLEGEVHTLDVTKQFINNRKWLIPELVYKHKDVALSYPL
jgi:hypothetical protein